MRKIQDEKAQVSVVMMAIMCAFDTELGAYWSGSIGASVARSARWVKPTILLV